MPRYKLTIAYDGTDFCGWQKQEPPAAPNISPGRLLDAPPPPSDSPHSAIPNPQSAIDPGSPRFILRTVQEIVERAVREVVREPIQLLGASRTDSGVHARGQVAAFSCSDEAWPLSRGPVRLLRAINSRLPEDTLITAVCAVSNAFDPISDCVAKGYSYTLHVSPHRPIWDRRFVHHVWVPLDLAAMNAAACRLIGEHDFAAFAAAGHGRLSTVRTVFDCHVAECPDAPQGAANTRTPQPPIADPFPPRRLRIDISGNGFLWNMVRIIAGTLVEVGRGKLTADDITTALTSGDRRHAGPTLPPTGLCLEWIRYRDNGPAPEPELGAAAL